MHIRRDAPLDAAGLRIGIAVSRYHHDITEALWKGAVDTFTGAGGSRADLDVVAAPGSFELTIVAQALAAREDLDGVVALGCIIRGETSHDRHLAGAIAGGLTRVALDARKPVAFGVLTCQSLHQARARAGGEHGNKGVEAMTAAIEAIRTLRALGAGAPAP